MANAVFTAKRGSKYDDAVENRYHFPRRYLGNVRKAEGDWIVYYESRRGGGRMVYFAMARVLSVDADPDRADHHYARMGGYLEFPRPVPFRFEGELLESSLRNPDGSTNQGAGIQAVRPIQIAEFDRICRLGLGAAPAEGAGTSDVVAATQQEYAGDRRITTLQRPVRDAAFARVVRSVYDNRCAMTGLKALDRAGNGEIEAAHIRSVEDDGPDSPRNGLALCRTFHWLFDRGLVSIADDGKVLRSADLPDEFFRLINSGGAILAPRDKELAPHVMFLRWHRKKHGFEEASAAINGSFTGNP